MIEDQTSQEPAIEPIHLNQPPRRNWTLWIAMGGCVVLVCSAMFIVLIIFAGPQVVQNLFPGRLTAAEEQQRTLTENNTMGDPKAPVHIIEYGDFQCPYCLSFWADTEPQLIEEYVNTGKVYFEFRAFPVIGPESYTAAEGAYCAGDQGKFWEFHDTLFTNWTGENVGDFTQEKLIQYADFLELDMDLFEQCLRDETHKGTVEQDRANGEADNVKATPTFIINGNLVEGSQPFEVLKHIIEEILDGNSGTLNG